MPHQQRRNSTAKHDGDDASAPLNNAREVVDPISHLPITIHDATEVELEQIPRPPSTKEGKRLREERAADTKQDSNQRHADMEQVIREAMDGQWEEDPIGDQRRTRVQTAIVAGLAAAIGSFGAMTIWEIISWMLFSRKGKGFSWFGLLFTPIACALFGIAVGFAALSVGMFQREPSHKFGSAKRILNTSESAPETAKWLNSLLGSLWPIINPSLFVPVCDILEDSMQATLPKLVRGVRVADIGQGTESIRILGIRWLDPGAAKQDVGDFKAEEGDFVSMEVVIAYRGKLTTTQGIRGRAANAHLLLEFYTSGGVMIPVWVELTGLLATARVRIQLTPNPPFLSLMTLSILGLPKVTMKCTPLAKNFFNVMDVPGLSSWVQASINLAVQEYVAPRSLAMDLKTMLMGRPKMDTEALGVVVLTIRRASGFQAKGNPLKGKNSAYGDVYVTVCWSKWGKPLWSTRIITAEEPIWEETTAILVGPSEFNSSESLKLELWDSDRFTADDKLGNVSVPLRELMESKQTHNRMSIREDGLTGDDGKPWPGKINWECGFFAKTTLDQHLEHKHMDANELRANIASEAEHKLREAKILETETGDDEVKQQKEEDLKEKTDEIIANSKPTNRWPSGILSIRIEQITGLEIQHVRESGVREDAVDEEAGDLPSAYCTVIIDHQRVYKTRTKMKSSNPFFDAGTEKFIRNWRTSDVIIAVRDSRFHERDPVVGLVILPLREVFKHNSQWSDSVPLVGGIGYGRMRVSLLFRSVQLQLPKRLLGWDLGTLEIQPTAHVSEDVPEEYRNYRLIFRTQHGKGKMFPNQEGGWQQAHDKPIRLAVTKRYASCMLVQFKKRARGPDVTPAFCTLWLKEIPDDTEVDLALPIIENVDHAMNKAEKNASSAFGKQVGTLHVRIKLFGGLSGYHRRLSGNDKNLADVMEVLDYAEASQDATKQMMDDEMGDDEEVDVSSSSSSSEDEGLGGKIKHASFPATATGPFSKMRKHQSELHTKHRGLLQWSGVRNIAWIGKGVEHKVGRMSGAVKGLSKHRTREPPLEKEVN